MYSETHQPFVLHRKASQRKGPPEERGRRTRKAPGSVLVMQRGLKDQQRKGKRATTGVKGSAFPSSNQRACNRESFQDARTELRGVRSELSETCFGTKRDRRYVFSDLQPNFDRHRKASQRKSPHVEHGRQRERHRAAFWSCNGG